MNAVTVDGLPFFRGAEGEAVRDLQRRLKAVGFDVGVDAINFGSGTEDAVRGFQGERGLVVDGVCGRDTWAALVEAGYRLGDRLLYLRRPMLRGDDIESLQLKLGSLGFDAGRVDGIFGPDTERALKDFQRNTALTTDGVCGPDVLAALERLGAMASGPESVAGVRERAVLEQAPRHLLDRRIVVGEIGGLEVVAGAVGRALQTAGAIVAVVNHPESSVIAIEANDFAAELFLGIALSHDGQSRAAFYATSGFESAGGRQLAELVAEAVPAAIGSTEMDVVGMRLPLLRETRMAAVVCHLAPVDKVVEHHLALATALVRAVSKWVEAPIAQ